MMGRDARLDREVEHGQKLSRLGHGELWYWSTPAGQLRWQRRKDMLTAKIRPDADVLEIGCGPGYLTKELAKTGARVTAVDISPELLEHARAAVPDKDVTFEVQNAYDLTYDADSFDIVVGSSVLHHLDVDRALQSCRRVLKSGGWLCLTEPNLMNPQVFLERRIPYLRKKLLVSPDEIAFLRGPLIRTLQRHGYTDVNVRHFDFLHPSVPQALIPVVKRIGLFAEKIPLLRAIAGSLYILARKPDSVTAETA